MREAFLLAVLFCKDRVRFLVDCVRTFFFERIIVKINFRW